MKIRPYAFSNRRNLRYTFVDLYGLTWADYPLLAVAVDDAHDEARCYVGVCIGPFEVGCFFE